jgi:serine/threonine-protein kinase
MAVRYGVQLERGEVIAGRYEILGEAPRQTFGSAYRAFDRTEKADVLLTALDAAPSADTGALDRLKARISQIAAVRSPYLVQPLTSLPFRNALLIVSQHEPLPVLADLLVPFEPLSVADSLTIALHLSTALTDLGNAGFVHGNLTPDCIHVGADTVKLSGLAAAWPRLRPDDTGELAVRRAEYAAPECHAGPDGIASESRPEPRSDIYSLGVILYRMLTGTVPFSGATPADVRRKRQQSPLPSLQRGLLGGLYMVLPRCLAKDPQKRYQSPGQLAWDLKRLLNSQAVKTAGGASILTWEPAATDRTAATSEPAAEPAHEAPGPDRPAEAGRPYAAATSTTPTPGYNGRPAAVPEAPRAAAATSTPAPAATPTGTAAVRTTALPEPVVPPSSHRPSETIPGRTLSAEPIPMHAAATARRLPAPAGQSSRAMQPPTSLAGTFKRFRAALSNGSNRAAIEIEAADPYTTLQVAPDADLHTITSAFRGLLKAALLDGDRTAAASLERAYARIRASVPSPEEREPLRRIR